MPHIMVTADQTGGHGETAVMLCERVTQLDFESQHFASQLLERLGWAVEDAHERERAEDAERRAPSADDQRHERTEGAQQYGRADDAQERGLPDGRVEIRSLGRRRVTLPTS